MTKKHYIMEINKINTWIQKTQTWKIQIRISKTKDSYFNRKGYKNQFLKKSARKKEVETYYECLVQACYDTIGDCI